MGTTVAWIWVVCSSMCRTAETRFSIPKVSCIHFTDCSHQSSSLPSCCILSIASGLAESITRMACTWFFPTLRLRCAFYIRCSIAADRDFTPSGKAINSRSRCMRLSSTLPAMKVCSIWADILEFALFAFSRWRTTKFAISWKFLVRCIGTFIIRLIRWCKYLFLKQGVQRGVTSLAHWEFFALLVLRLEKFPNEL